VRNERLLTITSFSTCIRIPIYTSWSRLGFNTCLSKTKTKTKTQQFQDQE